MAIDPKKVLLIRNTNTSNVPGLGISIASLSTSVSDWYAQARGLTDTSASDYFWLGFNFGNNTTKIATRRATEYNAFDVPGILSPPRNGNGSESYSLGETSAGCIVLDSNTTPVVCASQSSKITQNFLGQPIYFVIASLVSIYKIEAVFVLPGVPSALYGPFLSSAGYYYPQHIELALAASCNFNGMGWLDRFSPRNITGQEWHAGYAGELRTSGNASGIARGRPQLALSSISSLVPTHTTENAKVAWGRVGAVRDSTPSSLAQVQDMVNNAKQAELESSKTKLHVLGGVSYITRFGGILESVAVNYLGRDMGLTNFSHIEESTYVDPGTGQTVFWNSGYGYAEDDLWLVRPPYATPALARLNIVNAGTTVSGIESVSGGLITTFGFCSPRVGVNNSSNSKWQFAPGGWAYSWMSGADEVSYYALTNGASLGFTCAGEPFNINVPESSSLFFNLALGYTGAEAILRARSSTVYTGPSVRDLPSNTRMYSTGCYISAHGDPLYAPYKYDNIQKLMQVGV